MTRLQTAVIWITGILLLAAVLVPPWKFVGQTQLVFSHALGMARELQATGPYAPLFYPPVIPLTSYSEKAFGVQTSSPSGYFNGYPREDWNAVIDTSRGVLTCAAIIVPAVVLILTFGKRRKSIAEQRC